MDVLFCCDSEGNAFLLGRTCRAVGHTRILKLTALGVTALIGTVEELSVSARTQSLVREQFETNFYGPVNWIKSVLPGMRKRGGGHIIVLSSISMYIHQLRYLLLTSRQPTILEPQAWASPALPAGPLMGSATHSRTKSPPSTSRSASCSRAWRSTS